MLANLTTDWITAAASVLAAVGTIGAVAVSLWLAQRGQRPKITVQCQSGIVVVPRTFVMVGGPEDETSVVNLRATNEGTRAVTLSKVYVRADDGSAVAVLDDAVRARLPRVLQPGENLTVGWPRDYLTDATGYADERFFLAYFTDTVGNPYAAPYPGVRVVRLGRYGVRKGYRLRSGKVIPK